MSATSAQRFRSSRDLAFRVLYAHYARESRAWRIDPITLRSPSQNYVFVRVQSSGPALTDQLDQIAFQRPRFFCINDDLEDEAEADAARCAITRTMEAYFPHPSAFER